jgi:hypothetical protein
MAPDMALTNLAHHVDVALLAEAHKRTRKDAAAGIDGQTGSDYAEDLDTNLQKLWERLKSGKYRAPAVRRVHIPKGDGRKTRPTRLVMVFSDRSDADRVFSVLPKQLNRYGLTMHPDKTQMIFFRRPRRHRGDGNLRGPGTFDFLGFTHYWGKSRRGRWIVKRRTARNRLARVARAFHQWSKRHRHWRLAEQQRALSQKLKGHYAYYGITGNMDAMERLYRRVVRIWRTWLNRRNQQRHMTWERMNWLLGDYPLPTPEVVHSIYRHVAKATS